MTGLELKKALAGAPTANLAGLWAGYTGQGHKTVLPKEAHAKMDFRLVPDQDPQKLKALLRQHLERHGFGDVELKVQAETPAARTPITAPIVRVARETAREVFQKEPNVHVSSAGAAHGGHRLQPPLQQHPRAQREPADRRAPPGHEVDRRGDRALRGAHSLTGRMGRFRLALQAST